MQKIKRAILIGDIAGNDTFHVGDEAMLEANLGLLNHMAPGVKPTVVSLDPAYTAQIYGIDAVARIGFLSISSDRVAEQARINDLVEHAIRGEELIPDSFRALLDADLLVISGGGNLSSTWPEQILERLALVRLARKRGIPVIILGQTLGPYLEPCDKLLVSEILAGACWIGLREAPSVALAVELGVPLERIDYQLDDAIFLQGRPIEILWPRAADGADFPAVIAVTLHPFVAPDSDAPILDQFARELDRIYEGTGAHLLFVPHVRLSRDGEDFGDRAMGAALARRMTHREAMTVLDVQKTGETIWLTQRADMILSSRYHPLVFGLAAKRPCLALPTDGYTHIKLQGAMVHAGESDSLFPLDPFSVSGLADKAIAIFAAREEYRMRLGQTVARWRDAELDRERRLSQVLGGRKQNSSGSAENSELIQALARTLTLMGGEDPGGWKNRHLVHLLDHWQTTAEEAVKYARSLEDEYGHPR